MPVLKKDEEMRERYDEFVRNSPYGRANQDLNWGLVKNNWIQEAVYLEEDGQIIAALTILGIKAQDDRYFFYASRGPVCDPTDVELVKRLVAEAEPLFEKYHPFLLRMDPEQPYDADLVKAYEEAGFHVRSRDVEDIHSFSNPRFNFIMDLTGRTEDEILADFHSKTRYNIRYAGRKGVTTRWERTPEALDTFYELTKIMAERNGINHRPKDYFARLLKAFPKARIYISSYGDKDLSAAIALPYNKKLFYIYGASSNELRNKQPNYDMQWEMIRWGLEMGMEEYDFGGVFEFGPQNGLYRFKSGFCEVEGVTEFIGELDLVLDEEVYQHFLNR